jgi:hypothetical protein
MRTLEEISKDYMKNISELGDLTFNLEYDIPRRIGQLKKTIADLKGEHANLIASKASADQPAG